MKTKQSQRRVIISYSNTDMASAQKVCQSLEKAGLKCWMAPRDVEPGHDYAGQIMNAISNSDAMVLVLSGSSNKSPHVNREVERAVSKQIPIIPFVIEPVKLSSSMEYYVSSQHWLEAIDKPLEKHFPKLVSTVKGIMTEGLGRKQARENDAEVIGTPKQDNEPRQNLTAAQPEMLEAENKQWGKPKKHKMFLFALAAVTAGLLIILGVKYLNTFPELPFIKKASQSALKGKDRKDVTIMFFDNESGDSTLNWLQYGVSSLIVYDLGPDQYILTYTPEDYIDELKKAGYPMLIKMPLSLIQNILKNNKIPYFIAGRLVKTGIIYTINTTLYETKRCQIISCNKYSGSDIFNLVDQISMDIKRDLDFSKEQSEEANDLPVSEITTKSMSAYRLYTLGRNAIMLNNDYKQGIKLFEKAVEIDSSFAYAFWSLYDSYVKVNEKAKALKALTITMKHIYKFPDDDQYSVKYVYYQNNEPSKRYELCQSWIEQYPNNPAAHAQMGWACHNRGEYNLAIDHFKRAYDLDPHMDYCLRWLGGCYRDRGNYNKALIYYKQYLEKNKTQASPLIDIAEVYQEIGDYDNARKYYKKAELLEPENMNIKVFKAKIECKIGNMLAASDQLSETLKDAKTPEDSSEVYFGLMQYYIKKGQIQKMIENREKYFALLSKLLNPAEINQRKLWYFEYYALAGDKEAAFKLLKAIEKDLQFMDRVIYLWKNYMDIYIEMEDTDNAEKSLKQLDECMINNKSENQRSASIIGLAKIYELRKNYSEAIKYYQQDLKKYPGNIEDNVGIGKCYRLMGDLKNAEKYIKKTIKITAFDPDFNYEMALVYADMGKKDKAIFHLKRSLEVWAEADPDYKPAQKAREKLAELENK